ncbi:hypothetical protein OBBRIDRAFT_826210 [Obba rivulosa]|uniref:Uncharacterized protein n=1 Tax=Obba rivulosa TaxID=1052685 RepID=A0A8E2DK06_9APHY|nr:hypothetical protein OBBRIDRAFT_826210 [Obba rivulosa]
MRRDSEADIASPPSRRIRTAPLHPLLPSNTIMSLLQLLPPESYSAMCYRNTASPPQPAKPKEKSKGTVKKVLSALTPGNKDATRPRLSLPRHLRKLSMLPFKASKLASRSSATSKTTISASADAASSPSESDDSAIVTPDASSLSAVSAGQTEPHVQPIQVQEVPHVSLVVLEEPCMPEIDGEYLESESREQSDTSNDLTLRASTSEEDIPASFPSSGSELSLVLDPFTYGLAGEAVLEELCKEVNVVLAQARSHSRMRRSQMSALMRLVEIRETKSLQPSPWWPLVPDVMQQLDGLEAVEEQYEKSLVAFKNKVLAVSPPPHLMFDSVEESVGVPPDFPQQLDLPSAVGCDLPQPVSGEVWADPPEVSTRLPDILSTTGATAPMISGGLPGVLSLTATSTAAPGQRTGAGRPRRSRCRRVLPLARYIMPQPSLRDCRLPPSATEDTDTALARAQPLSPEERRAAPRLGAPQYDRCDAAPPPKPRIQLRRRLASLADGIRALNGKAPRNFRAIASHLGRTKHGPAAALPAEFRFTFRLPRMCAAHDLADGVQRRCERRMRRVRTQSAGGGDGGDACGATEGEWARAERVVRLAAYVLAQLEKEGVRARV